jgi:hypothetical protein
MKEICKYIAKSDQSLVYVRGERRGSSAECSPEACEEATEGRRSIVSGGRGGSGGAPIERFDERLEGGSDGPPDFQRGPVGSVTPPSLRPRAVGSRTIIPPSTTQFGGDVGWTCLSEILLFVLSISLNGFPIGEWIAVDWSWRSQRRSTRSR